MNKMNLHVQEGEIYGFLGSNGAGKTTALKFLLGLIEPFEETINIFGKSLRKHRPSILQHTGSLIETPSYYGHLTGLENMKVMQRLRNAMRPFALYDWKITRTKEFTNILLG